MTQFKHASREGYRPFFRVTLGSVTDHHELEFEVPTRAAVVQRVHQHLNMKGERWKQWRRCTDLAIAHEAYRVVAIQPQGQRG